MKIYTLHFGKFHFFSNIIFGEINTGVHYNMELNEQVCELAKAHFGDNRSFAYISTRTNDYSVDPLVHHINRYSENLKCVAVVDPNGIKTSAKLESKFYHSNMLDIFYSLDDALKWVNSILHKPILAARNYQEPKNLVMSHA